MLFSAVCGFLGCEGDGDKSYGFEQIYMPQAARGEYFKVPDGGGEYTHNFVVEDGELKIILCVSRAGSSPYGSYSVNISVDDDATDDFVSRDPTRMVMPNSIYYLPSEVTVTGLSAGGMFYLVIPTSDLNKAAYNNKILVLCVRIDNPTAYELAEDNSMTTVVVDVRQIRDFL